MSTDLTPIGAVSAVVSAVDAAADVFRALRW
jgi:hypothetical protein